MLEIDTQLKLFFETKIDFSRVTKAIEYEKISCWLSAEMFRAEDNEKKLF